MNDVHLFISWLTRRRVGVLNPGVITDRIGFLPGWDMGKTWSFFAGSPGHPIAHGLSCFCFTLAFGALRAPAGFDLGRKEIEN